MKTTTIISKPSEIIGNPIKIQRLEFAQYDFPNEMNWVDAKIACAKLGSGWRLPYIHELNLLYAFKNKIGGFTDRKGSYHNYYWSSTETQNSDTCFFAWYIDLENGDKTGYYEYGNQDWNDKHNTFYVRAVRSDTTSPIGITTKINEDTHFGKLPQGLEVAQYDFPDRMNWSDAKAACEKLGDGWRLPNDREITIIKLQSYLYNKDHINGNFNDGKYWYTDLLSNSKSEGRLEDFGLQLTGGYRKNKFNLHHVRAVRGFDNSNYDSEKADQVIAKYINEIGGVDKWSKIQTIKIEGEIESRKLITPFVIRGAHMKGIRLDLKIYGSNLIDQIITPFKEMRQDATVGNTKLNRISEYELKYNLDDLDIQDAFINYKEKGSVIESLGSSYITFNRLNGEGEDVQYIKIKMTTKNNLEKIYYFNTKTNLIDKVESIVKKQGQEIVSETMYYSDYQKIDYGIKVPFTKKNINEMKIVTKLITINPTISLRIFEGN